MIELTVVMPMFKSKYIAWLALESLIRQKNIGFRWEIIAAEETGNEAFGEVEFMKYKEALEKVHCKKITYIPLTTHILLPHKYVLMAKHIDPSSKVFVIQSADCYSQPNRLVQTYNIIVKENFDWTYSDIGLFYNIGTEHTALYDQRGRGKNRGLNMAVKTNLIKKAVPVKLQKGIDKWLVSQCASAKGSQLLTKVNDSEDWIHGVDTQGLNTISIRRQKKMTSTKYGFFKTKQRIRNVLPSEIVSRLLECKKYCRKGFV